MATWEDISAAVERVKAVRRQYDERGAQSAVTGQRRWDALREARGDRNAAAVLAADAGQRDAHAASVHAFGTLGATLADMYALALPPRKDEPA